jgi:DNA repair exonuclease SbcCD nuclease subunit
VKLAHLADLHLGFRQYARLTPQGVNQREADVALVFRRALDAVAETAPDIVVVAGDLFHSVRPTNTAILDAFQQFQRLRARLPGVPIVLLPGNHDTPRAVETGTILKLFEAAVDGVHVVPPYQPRRLAFEALGLSVLGVPHFAWSLPAPPPITADPEARFNVLLTHREVEGVLPREAAASDYGSVPIKRSDLNAGAFDYVALGHYHVATQVDRNACYAGSLEYVTTNPWWEATQRGVAAAGLKGWLLVELGTGEPRIRFQPVEPARRVLDLEPIHGAGLGAAELDRAVAGAAHGIRGGLEGQIVRQLVWDVDRLTARDLNHAAVRDLKTRALHYRLDLRRPTVQREVGVSAAGRRQTLDELVAEHLRARILPPGVSRERVLALAEAYLAAVGREEG